MPSNWTGNVLGDEVAVALIEDPTGTAGEGTAVLVACSRDESAVVTVEQLAEFVFRHVDAAACFCCNDAATLHWRLHGVIGTSSCQAAREALWSLSRRHRLVDVMLLDQRLNLAINGLFCRPSEFSQLFEAWTGGTGNSQVGTVASLHTEIESASQGLVSDKTVAVVIRAKAVLLVYEAQREKAAQLARAAGNPATLTSEFGPLAIGIDVQGAIAVSEATDIASRLDPARVPKV